jgi:hypothetical protein
MIWNGFPLSKNSVLLNENVFFEDWADTKRPAKNNDIVNNEGRNKPFIFFIEAVNKIKNRGDRKASIHQACCKRKY